MREDHSLVEKGEGKEAVNTIVCINPDTQEQQILVGDVSSGLSHNTHSLIQVILSYK